MEEADRFIPAEKEEKVNPEVPSSEHLCYVRCNFCSTVLAVGIPCKRLLETVTVKCGHCNNLSFLSTRPPNQGQCLDHHQLSLQGDASSEKRLFKEKQGSWTDFRNGESSSSSTSCQPLVPHEIQRIKAANPEIPHREAFSTAAKNWARFVLYKGNQRREEGIAGSREQFFMSHTF
ncbi:unnamed protein product [Dovyalis caffra]|uniref:CRABS CLAW n=1 Tax=Dovyalis caffra TaxID=77055 RepID=A0AAV1QWX6_9ROSI|nr:unnamed protein product [Dovyalis caffra]